MGGLEIGAMGEYVLSLDQGTTSSRAILFDRGGAVAGVAQHEFRQIYPTEKQGRPPETQGWVEHDPFEILTSQLSAAVEVLGRTGVRPRDVAALGIGNQRETTIVWERATGKPIYNAIVWQDRRTAGMCEELARAGAEDEVRRRTGLLLDPYFSGTKVAWILEITWTGRAARAERGELLFGTVDSWLVWNLTERQAACDGPDATPRGRCCTTWWKTGGMRRCCGCCGCRRVDAAGGGVVKRAGGAGDDDAGAGRDRDCRDRGGPAGGAVWAACVRSRAMQRTRMARGAFCCSTRAERFG